MIDNREMAEFASSLWENFIKYRHQEADESTVSFYKAQVTVNNRNGLLGIQRPFETTTTYVSCPSYMEEVSIGEQVLVLRFGNGSNLLNHFVIDNAARTMMASAISTGSSIAFPVSIPNGGTGATTLADAKSNLGVPNPSDATPNMDGTASAGSLTAFSRGDHTHPTDTSRAAASDVTSLSGRVDDLEDAVGSGGDIDTRIATAIQGLDSSISATTNQAIASVTITDGKISASTKATIPTNNNQLTNGAGYQTASDVQTAITSATTTVMDYKGTKATVAELPSSGNKTGDVWHVTADDSEYVWDGSAWETLGGSSAPASTPATDSDYGTVKLNTAESIGMNASGQLTVGGRLGQYPDGGVYYPADIEPSEVGTSSFLMTDGAKGISAYSRTFAIMAGVNITCKSTPANSTTYRLSNTQSNRFACFAVKGGRLALNQQDAIDNGTALITSIKFANGNDITPYFGPTESNNDIIITVNRTVNPSAATTALRGYGTNLANDNILVGQGVGGSNGKGISLGQSTYVGGNQTVAIGNSCAVLANNSVALGHTHLVNKQFCFACGQGHDFTNGSNGSSAVGVASSISSNTAFAVGNGTFNSNGNITRSNAFEVTTDGGIVLKSPNGTRYKITVSNTGELTTTAL